MYANAGRAAVEDLIANQRKSTIGSIEYPVRGQVKDYDPTVAQLGYRIFQAKEDFDAVDSVFKSVVDSKGVPMSDVARRYWDDPEFAEQQRQEIAERKRRGR